MRSIRSCSLAAAALCVLLGGCATAPTANQPSPAPPYAAKSTTSANPETHQAANTRKAFGRVVALRDGEPTNLGEFQWSGTLTCEALVHRESDDHGSASAFGEGGWFEWNLAPGDYVLASMYCTFKKTRYTLPLDLRFKVGADEDHYIGHLGFDFAKERFQHVAFGSKESEAVDEFARRHPGSPAIGRQLAVRDVGPGTYDKMYSVCGARWKIECSRASQGVEPTNPPIDHGLRGLGFTNVDSLTPKLQWKPVVAPDVHYDVVVWEAVRYESPIGMRDLYEPGRVVFYEQDLATSEVTLSESLKPGTKYFWSVRLRQNGEVSTWSTAGQTLILIVFNSWTSGQWFALKTP